jgi:CheY-like chemotaxis protein
MKMTTSASSTIRTLARRILLVEDNRDNRETLRMVVESWGHRVAVAEDGGEGVEKALTWKPDAAVVDIGLPVLDGLEVARKMREAFRERILLIALTGFSQPEDRRRALEAGFNVHMTKPADFEALEQILSEGVESLP